MIHIGRRRFLTGAAVASAGAALAGAKGAPAEAAGRLAVARLVPDPNAVVVTRWASDQFALGSYSFPRVGTQDGDRASLAAPAGDRLFMAGEATSSDRPSTVDGAYTTGRRVGREVAASHPGGSRVIVIGAGIAGLAAAVELAATGFDVTIVEARDRLGGRMHTDHSLGAAIDLGASWMHGTAGNPITKIADQIGARHVPSRYERIVASDSAGRRLGLIELLFGALIAEYAYGPLARAARRAGTGDDLAGDIEDLWFWPFLRGGLAEATRLALELPILYDFAADLDEISLRLHDEFEEIAGNDRAFPDGYNQITDHIARNLDVRLSQTVVGIDHGGGTSRVHTTSQTFDADAVVCTLPLGVLKRGDVSFDPPLPPETRAAIDRIGMGLLNKVYLQFDKRFWNREADYIASRSAPHGLFGTWVNYERVNGEPILMAFTAGRAAQSLENSDDNETAERALDALSHMAF